MTVTDKKDIIILGIESSCDETSAAVSRNTQILSNVIANQTVHQKYGGVVPELASRAHQSNIVPVVDQALREAAINISDVDAIAFTRGPGLIGSLMVGVSFAKSAAAALNKPLIEVNHMQAHVLANFLSLEGQEGKTPSFPFLCLTVSGGHTQIVRVTSPQQMEIIGQTLDDAAGEAFDKIAKVFELPYPGGPLIDRYAQSGNPKAFNFPVANLPGLNYSFSGLKTSVLYFLKKQLAQNPAFIAENRDDLCASVQYTIVKTLILKLKKAALETGISNIAIAGGVSANSGLRKAVTEEAVKNNWQVHIPPLSLCTDNGGMICLAAYFKYLAADFSTLDVAPSARFGF
ncbi:MAG TPA: tRNA (adenosine(37)-N6)-threonylcarbamoyltransferase complex transferase subunit TsaD [Bacteroidia bacterium]|nr:tRNA (adenosine(37)-N6)-threonylcarbamoyltransferase complex transferase subunit TsaD [Bacteroidia bacterium]HOZ82085.1 tRNA (adenosine(37)-N6)-threonylcarbamoyltransferase complex transferase subunit TsaD [Bacteroidia bacterium]HOZ89358.1 tRNA (adenosine(37)-N6)-threonylcarbamoyltransferase complex transferase subunit TsaD [Bacteroidia bacterium]HQW17494.1 tRNA (adenosine(37)-N6)-threonylcarbamoyltransferase complex transferase subunit TsaD [Bacteroidia bacterium]HQW49026.1 tRNA (adenosine(